MSMEDPENFLGWGGGGWGGESYYSNLIIQGCPRLIFMNLINLSFQAGGGGLWITPLSVD